MMLKEIINLNSYPLDRMDSDAYRQMVSDKRRDLDSNQFCSLPGFLLDRQRQKIVTAVEKQQANTHRADSMRNVYLERSRDESFADDHPKNIFARGCYNMMGAHLLDEDSPLKVLYYWAPMQRFIAEIVGVERLYPSADPYQPVNVLCQGDGDRSAWHFDSSNAFTMTLMLQAPESGGHFEIVPNTRSDDNANYVGITRLLQGKENHSIRVSRSEGELVIFRGCNSAHRVTPVSGKRRRLMCVMVYEMKPNVIGDPVVNETVYGVKIS